MVDISIPAYIPSTPTQLFGGGVWESNPPKPTLAGSLTGLKPAETTRPHSPPLLLRQHEHCTSPPAANRRHFSGAARIPACLLSFLGSHGSLRAFPGFPPA